MVQGTAEQPMCLVGHCEALEVCEMGAIGGFGAEERSNPTSVLIDNSMLDTGREG